MRLGLIARCDNGGLGIESVEFARALSPARVLCVCGAYENHPERFPGAQLTDLHPSEAEVDRFLDPEAIDCVLTVETPYNWELFSMARRRRIRTVMKVNYEWLEMRGRPDAYVLPNGWHFDDVPNPKHVAALPVDLERFAFVERRSARTFLHVAGHNAGYDRNGTAVLMQALKYVRSDVRVLVRSQLPVARFAAFFNGSQAVGDPRVQFVGHDLAENEKLYEGGDVLVLPRRYGGQSLVMEEAAACGMPMILSDMEPQRSLFRGGAARFVPLQDANRLRIKTEIEIGHPSPWELASAMDAMAAEPPEKLAARSRAARAAVEGRSWDAWRVILANGNG